MSSRNVDVTAFVGFDSFVALVVRGASAFDMEIGELDFRKVPAMTRYEYKSVVFSTKGLMQKAPDMAPVLNKEGEQGWRVCGILVAGRARGGLRFLSR